MKSVKTILIGSLTALPFTNNLFAQENETLQSLANSEITYLLQSDINNLQKFDTRLLVAKYVKQQQLAFKTQELVKEATKSLPKNKFKVVIAD